MCLPAKSNHRSAAKAQLLPPSTRDPVLGRAGPNRALTTRTPADQYLPFRAPTPAPAVAKRSAAPSLARIERRVPTPSNSHIHPDGHGAREKLQDNPLRELGWRRTAADSTAYCSAPTSLRRAHEETVLRPEFESA